MLNEFEAKINACGKIADLFGIEYFKSHISSAFEAYQNQNEEFKYFIGFESDENGEWKVFAKILVNRTTKTSIFLDYKKPDGLRMENPVEPISFTH